jgi:hypothetical protein
MKNILFGIIQDNAEREGCSWQNSLRDVLTDLRHVAKDQGLDFIVADASAGVVYQEEQAAVATLLRFPT